MTKLSEIFDLQMGKTPARANADYWKNGTNNWVSIADLSGYEKYVEETKEQITDVAVQESGIKIVPPNTVIMSFKLSLGKTAITQESVYTNEAIMAFIPKGTYEISPDYFFYLLSGKDWSEGTNRAVMGATLNKATLGEISITLPPIGEQCRTATVLDKVSGLISLRKQQLAKLDELVKARFVEMFGDSVFNPFEWEKDLLGTVCDVRDGTHDSPQYYETGFPLVTSKNVTGGKIDLTDCSLICEADFKKISERSKVDMGDIIMPMIGTVGKPVIVDTEPNFAIKNVCLIKFKPVSRVLNIYIRSLLQSDYFDEAVLSKVRGGTQKFISLGDIRKLEILVPPIVIQEQFAVFIEQTEKSKLTIQQSLDKLELLKKSLMQKYFG